MTTQLDNQDETFVTLIPKHRVQLQDALEQELLNRLENLEFHNILVFQRFYDKALSQIKSGTMNVNVLNWCYQQFRNYGAVGKKDYLKTLIKWMPCAIQLPSTYEHLPDYQVEYIKQPKKSFDDDIGRFLFQAQCFSEFFDLDFSFIYTEYVLGKKKLKMYQWMLMSKMFGDNKMRNSLASRLELPVSVIPKMPLAYSTHLNQMDNIILDESYSALEIVAKLKRHQTTVITLGLSMVDKKMWYDKNDRLVFNPLSEEQRDRGRELFLLVMEKDFQIEKSLRGEVNHLLKDLGLKGRVLYWV